jgi:hypothetical protein
VSAHFSCSLTVCCSDQYDKAAPRNVRRGADWSNLACRLLGSLTEAEDARPEGLRPAGTPSPGSNATLTAAGHGVGKQETRERPRLRKGAAGLRVKPVR